MNSLSRCVTRTFRQVVRGTGIRRVTFTVNGRRVARVTGRRGASAVRIDPRAYSTGALRITARVEYVTASRQACPDAAHRPVLRCSETRTAARPRFAG